MDTWASGRPFPEMPGVAVWTAAPSGGFRISGRATAESTMKGRSSVEGLVRTPSVARAETTCAPGASGETGVYRQFPAASTATDSATAASNVRSTVFPVCDVPKRVGVAVGITCPAVGERMAGVTGAGTETWNSTSPESGLLFPAASRARATTAYSPSPSGAVGVKIQVPVSLATVKPATEPFNDTVTVVLASAVPETVGNLVTNVVWLAGDWTTGAAGATVSTVKETAVAAGPTF